MNDFIFSFVLGSLLEDGFCVYPCSVTRFHLGTLPAAKFFLPPIYVERLEQAVGCIPICLLPISFIRLEFGSTPKYFPNVIIAYSKEECVRIVLSNDLTMLFIPGKKYSTSDKHVI